MLQSVQICDDISYKLSFSNGANLRSNFNTIYEVYADIYHKNTYVIF